MTDATRTGDVQRMTWAEYDPVIAESNLRRMRRRSCMTMLAFALGFFCFLSVLTNVLQSYIGEWLAAPPLYPGAILTDERIGQVCTPTLAVYCAQRIYETRDPAEQVVAYYENLGDLRFRAQRPPLRFRSENAFPYGQQLAVQYCRYVVGYRSFVKIAVHPLNVGSEIYVQEMGGAQRMPDC